MNLGKTAETLEVCAEIILASEELEIDMMKKLCLTLLNGEVLPNEWQINEEVLIFKKNKRRESQSYMGAKRLEQGFSTFILSFTPWQISKVNFAPQMF